METRSSRVRWNGCGQKKNYDLHDQTVQQSPGNAAVVTCSPCRCCVGVSVLLLSSGLLAVVAARPVCASASAARDLFVVED